MMPRIDHIDTATLEIGHIPGGHGRGMNASRRGDLAIGKADRTAGDAALDEDFGESDRSDAIEGQHAAREVASQDRLDRIRQRRASSPCRKESNAPTQFGLADGGKVDLRAILGG